MKIYLNLGFFEEGFVTTDWHECHVKRQTIAGFMGINIQVSRKKAAKVERKYYLIKSFSCNKLNTIFLASFKPSLSNLHPAWLALSYFFMVFTNLTHCS
jgi:hypothetical protein